MKLIYNLFKHFYLPILIWFMFGQIRPDLGRIEKWIIRNAFDDEQTPYLPKVCSFSL